MGTNYYIRQKECQHCHHRPDDIHIGKSSAGWVFALHVDDQFKCLDDYINYVKDNDLKIHNEYDEEIDVDSFKSICLDRGMSITIEQSTNCHNHLYKTTLTVQQYLDRNHAVEGPRNLLRSKIDGHCIGYDGDIDLIQSDFS